MILLQNVHIGNGRNGLVFSWKLAFFGVVLGGVSCKIYIYIYGHRPPQGLPFLILEGGDAIEIFTIK